MRKWIQHWVMVVAGMILLAHNLTPHQHHTHITGTPENWRAEDAADPREVAHHHHDDGDDNESDGFALHHSIDHSFVTDHMLDLHAHAPVLVALLPVICWVIAPPTMLYKRNFPESTDGGPPVAAPVLSLSFRGPPFC